MEVCCQGFKEFYKEGSFVLENDTHFYLRSRDIKHPEIPTFHQLRLMKRCPFCGEKFGGKK